MFTTRGLICRALSVDPDILGKYSLENSTWNPKSWRFGSDDVPFQTKGMMFVGSMLILQSVHHLGN